MFYGVKPMEHTNTLTIVVAVSGVFIGILQGLILMILNGIRGDIKDLWSRIYDHYHEITCSNDQCHMLKTGNVVVPGAKGK